VCVCKIFFPHVSSGAFLLLISSSMSGLLSNAKAVCEMDDFKRDAPDGAFGAMFLNELYLAFHTFPGL
jgi:hypothetical protein